MTNSDITHRFIFEKSDIRGEITSLTDSYTSAYAHQSFPETLRPLFGEFLAAASLLSEILKFEGILTIQAKGSNDVLLIASESDHEGNVRGIIRMQPESDTKDFSKSFKEIMGNGHLVITIDPNKGERYQGIIAITSDSLSECLSEYFATSEQLPTFVMLHATNSQASGLFLQCLPSQNVKNSEDREDQWLTAKHLASTCSEDELLTLSHEEILIRLFNEFDCRLFKPKQIKFHCSCTRERSARALVSIGRDEAYELLHERDIINIDCEFCGANYVFSGEDLDELFPPESKVH